MAKRLPWRRVKTHRNYTFDEAGRILGVHKQTVSNWGKNCGLEVIADCKPYLVRGEVLRDFLQDRQATAKSPLGRFEMFCMSCRRARRPGFDLVEDISKASGPGMARGLCPDCGTWMHRAVSRSEILTFLGQGRTRSGEQ